MTRHEGSLPRERVILDGSDAGRPVEWQIEVRTRPRNVTPAPVEGGSLREGERVYVLLDNGERVQHGVLERFDGLLGWIRMDEPGGLVQPIPAPLERIHPDDGRPRPECAHRDARSA